MFVVDQSGSNGNTDPSKARRKDAITNFFSKHSGNSTIEWGFIGFQSSGATAFLSSPYFQPAASFMSAVHKFEEAGDTGGTPYKAAINEVTDAVLESVTNESEEMEPTYEIIFLSDGVPTDYGNPISDSEIASDIERLVKLAEGRIHFSTVYYNVAGSADLSAAERLETMSSIGGGKFLDASAGGEIQIDGLTAKIPSKEPYIMKDFFVYNMNSTLCDSGALGPDSDADGLCDTDEAFYNSKYSEQIAADPALAGKSFDSQNRNSFSIQFSDYFILRKIREEALPSCTDEEALKDEDRDLLNDCEEKFLVNRSPAGPTLTWTTEMISSPKNTSNTNFDSDGDALLDSLEFFFFREKGSALDYTNTKNLISNITYYDLFKNHQSKIYPQLSKPYEIKVSPIQRNDNGENCYTYEQEILPTYNVQAATGNTKPELAHASDENVILVYYIMAPENDPNGKGVLRYSYQKIKTTLVDSHKTLNLADNVFEEIFGK